MQRNHLPMRLHVTNRNFIILCDQVSDKLNRLDNKVSGKGKRGAQLLTNTSILCAVS